jgi:hypothetical protein
VEPTQTDTSQAPVAQPGEVVVSPLEASEQLTPEVTEEAAVEPQEQYEDGVEPAFQWQASEYVQHHKGAGWYIALGLVFLVLIGIAAVTQQWLSIAVLLVMAAAVGVYAHKPPRTLLYQLDEDGITIEERQYPYEQFRSFAVLQDESWHAIDLEPTQRFMPRLTVIFDSEDLDGIVEHLSLHLPRADREPDLVEKLTRYLRF